MPAMPEMFFQKLRVWDLGPAKPVQAEFYNKRLVSSARLSRFLQLLCTRRSCPPRTGMSRFMSSESGRPAFYCLSLTGEVRYDGISHFLAGGSDGGGVI